MKIALLSKRKELITNSEKFVIQGRRVGIFEGLFVLSRDEIKMIKKVCQIIWREIVKVNPSFQGLVRFDLVPKVIPPLKHTLWQGMPAFETSLDIRGIYEVNAHSPECASATAALWAARPELQQFQTDAVQRLVEAIRESIGSRPIGFLCGNGPVKIAWKDVFLRALRERGLMIKELDLSDIQTTTLANPPRIIWRWGDIRFNQRFSEFPLWAQKRLLEISRHKSRIIFNTIPVNGNDVADKRLLINRNENPVWNHLVGRNVILKPSLKNWAMKQKDNLVLKPLRGSSGRGVVLGKVTSEWEWTKHLQEALQGQKQNSYGLYEARYLPEISLDKDVDVIVFDINPAFWAEGERLEYLYTVIRVDKAQTYKKRGTINVAQGAGFAGTAAEE